MKTKKGLVVRIFHIVCFICAVILFMNINKFTELNELRAEKVTLIEEYDKLKQQSVTNKMLLKNIFGKEPSEIKSKIVTVTAYSARTQECDENPHVTANGQLSLVGVVAVSRDLEQYIPLNSFIYIPGMGVYKVSDRMNQRWKNRIDIMAGNLKAARMFGKKEMEIQFF